MRYLCRFCRTEVAELATSCPSCHAVLDRRSRLPVADVAAPLEPETPVGSGPPPGTPVGRAADRLAPVARHSDSPGPPGVGRRPAGTKAAARHIGVRPFEPVKPGQKSEPPLPEPAPPRTELPLTGPDDGPPGRELAPGLLGGGSSQRCLACGALNAASLHFCGTCRKPLDGPRGPKGPSVRSPEGRDRWYRRLVGTSRHGRIDTRTVAQRARDRRLSRQLRGSLGLSFRSRLALILGSGGLLLLALLALGPLRDTIQRAVSPPSEPVAFQATLQLGELYDEDHGADKLSDGGEEVGLQLAWNGPPTVAASCEDNEQGPGRPPVVKLNFDGAAAPAVARLRVGVVPVEEGQSPLLFPGPRRLTLRGEYGCLSDIEIADDATWVVYEVGEIVGDGGWLEIRIMERWERPNVDAYPLVSLAEVELLR